MTSENQVKAAFLQLTNEKYYEAWLDKQLPVFGLKTPRQMLSENRGEEILAVLNRLKNGGYYE